MYQEIFSVNLSELFAVDIYLHNTQEDARLPQENGGEISDEGSMKNHLAWPRDSAPETRR